MKRFAEGWGAVLTAVLVFLAGCAGVEIRRNQGEETFPPAEEAAEYQTGAFLSAEETEEYLPKAAVSVSRAADGIGYCLQAVYQKDADFQEEMQELISVLQERYEDSFAYGLRGGDPLDYRNRYSGRLVWIQDSSALLLTLDRNTDAKARLQVELKAGQAASVIGRIMEKADHYFKVSVTNAEGAEEEWWIFMDDDAYMLYPDPFTGLETGDLVQIWYTDEAESFGTAYEDEISCRAIAVKKVQ